MGLADKKVQNVGRCTSTAPRYFILAEIRSEIALDVELIHVLLFFHHQFFMVEVKMHAAAVIRIAGQAQQGVHALLLVLGIEQVAGAFALGAAGA